MPRSPARGMVVLMSTPETSTTPSPAGRFARFTSWLFCSKTFKWVLFCAVPCLLMLLLAVVWFEDWRGQRAWEKFRVEWEAKGEKFGWRSLVPPPVPDEENFAKTPLLAGLFNQKWDPHTKQVKMDEVAHERAESAFPKWNVRNAGNWRLGEPTDLAVILKAHLDAEKITNAPAGPPAPLLLAALERYRPGFDELTAASKLPHARYDIRYEHGAATLLPHLAVLRSAARTFHYRAAAHLALGQTDAALADVKMQFYIARTLRSEPVLISQLVHIALLESALQDVWDGLVTRRWSDAHLQELQRELAHEDMLASFDFAIRGERDIFSNVFFDTILAGDREQLRMVFNASGADDASAVGMRFIPKGWIYQNKLAVNRMFLEITLPMVDVKARRVFPAKVAASDARLKTMRTTPYNIFCKLLFPAVSRSTQRFATMQTSVDQALVACALERHRLSKGQLPETLDALVPSFIAQLPRDVVSGKPVQYRREAAGHFTIWSVGWDGKDDNGTVATKGSSSVDYDKGDWTWPAPAKK